MRIMWITSRLLPDACRAVGFPEPVVGGWMQAQLDALQKRYGNEHEYFVLASDSRKCDVQLANVRHRSFGDGRATYGDRIPNRLEADAASAIAEFEPDIIHIHGTEFFYGRMSKRTYHDVPVIVSLQGILHGCHPFVNGAISQREMFWEQFNLRRLVTGCSVFNEQTLWREMRVPQERLVFRTHRHFMGRTDWDRAWMAALHPDATFHLVNETLRSAFYNGALRVRERIRPHSIYCSAAAGYPLKGVHVLFRAVSFLKGKYPDLTVRICSAERLSRGRSVADILRADQYTSYLMHLMQSLGIADRVIGLPRLSAAEVAVELVHAEVFVLPSFCENSPNSLGEAQLIGTPAIATAVGGIPSVLRDGIDGRLVQAGDPAVLASVIDWYFAHPACADAYARMARENASVRHDCMKNAEATLTAYENVVELERRV